LILMRNKGAVPPIRLLQLFFQLMAVMPDKNLHKCLYHHVVNDIRNINKNGRRDEKLNRTIQPFFHRIVSASANESSPGGRSPPSTGGGGNPPPTRSSAMSSTPAGSTGVPLAPVKQWLHKKRNIEDNNRHVHIAEE
jgi:hypothetical protein